MKKVVLGLLVLVSLISAEPSRGAYVNLNNDLAYAFQKLPNDMTFSVYRNEKNLQPLLDDISRITKIFYNRHDDIPYSIKIQIEEVYNKTQIVEKEKQKFNSMVGGHMKDIKGMIDSGKSEDLGGMLINALHFKISENDTNIQQKKLENAYISMRNSVIKLKNKLATKF
jgi:hypothetical protein